MNKYLIRELENISKTINASEEILLGFYDNKKITGYFFDNKCEKTIIIVGMPHGNEPIGFFYCKKYLLKVDVKKRYNYFIVPILDYEIAMKNIWINECFDYNEFLVNNYINKVESQIEFNYGKTSRLAHHKKFIDYLYTLKIHCVLFIHQIPSIYGGYFYTNIDNRVIINKLKDCFLKEQIPLDIYGQGRVEKKDMGVFGLFKADNILLDSSFLSSQEFINYSLNSPFITIEIPFAIPNISCLNKSVDFNTEVILEIISSSKDIENSIKKIKGYTKSQDDFEYWISLNNNMDESIKKIFAKLTEYKVIDIYMVLRSFMLKLSYLPMGLKIKGLDKEIRLKIINLQKKIWWFYKKNKNVIGINYINYDRGIRCIDNCVDIIEGYSDIKNDSL